MSDDPPGWDGYNVRSDRVQVVRQYDINNVEHWVIVPPDERDAILLCPYCDLPMRTELAAKRVCEAVYPLPESLR